MILEPGEIALINEIAAWRRKAHAEPDPFAANLAQERADIDTAKRWAQRKLEELFAVAFASLDTLTLPAGVEYLGTMSVPGKGTILHFNDVADAAGNRRSFSLPLTGSIGARLEDLRAMQQTAA